VIEFNTKTVLIIIGFVIAFSIQYTLNLILAELRNIKKIIELKDYYKE